MKTFLKSGMYIFLSLSLIGGGLSSSCNIFEFREKCKGTPEVFEDDLTKKLEWSDGQRKTFYSHVEDGSSIWLWNTGIYQLACAENPVSAQVTVSLLKGADPAPIVKVIMTTTAELQNIEDFDLPKTGTSDDGIYQYYNRAMTMDFNNPNKGYLYGSVNVQTVIKIPLPAGFEDTAENRAVAIQHIENIVQWVEVKIDYKY